MAKSRQQKMRDKAKERHKNFKRTGVQTHGGTRKNYTKKEARKILRSGLDFNKVTGGAKNPLDRAPDNQGVRFGKVLAPVQEFSDSLDLDYSAFEGMPNAFDAKDTGPTFSDSLRMSEMSGARFNEAGRNDLGGNRDTAFLPNFMKKSIFPNAAEQGQQYLDGVRDTNAADDTKGLQNLFKRFQQRDEMLDQSYTGGGDMIATNYNDLSPGLQNILQNQYKAFEKQDKGAPELKRLQNLYPGFTPRASINDGTLLASADISSLSGLGGSGPKSTGYVPSDGGSLARSLGLDPNTGQEVRSGGLNVGTSGFGLSVDQQGRLSRAFDRGPSNRMLSEGGDLRMSDMFQADTQGARFTERINEFKNRLPLLNRLPDMKLNSVAEEAQRRYLGFNPNLPSGVLKQRRGGGARLASKPTTAQRLSPQTQPVPSPSTTDFTQTGVDPNRLLEIQQQAYNQVYNPLVIGGFNPEFRAASSAPMIDYSTYFNY